ncbi:MAG: D-alanyl-D-alanine carboxypeptidase [Oscillospiraceae bacterium]|nr:D-alanyl-D-alanine carboxypeptidase [Oscillospiraceae bacterium]
MFFFLSTESFANPKSAVLIEKESGRVLFEINKDEPLPMASTTKIMTALIALEEDNIDEYFTVDRNAIKTEGSSMGLLEGDKATLRVLAAGMLLSSGNDAANAAAVRISGSMENFVLLMNKRAKEMGLESTSFETPSGLDGEKHFSSAYDMALLAKKALENPDFAAICGAKSLRVEYGNPPYARTLTNHNRLLKSLEGATGVKTGFTKKAGRCLVSSAEREGVSLICVTLGCADDWNYHTALYEEYFAKLESVKMDEAAVIIPVSGGEKNTVFAKSLSVSASLFEGEAEKIEVIISREPFAFAPVEKNRILGKVIYKLDGKIIAEAPLLAEETVERISENQGFWNDIKEIF